MLKLKEIQKKNKKFLDHFKQQYFDATNFRVYIENLSLNSEAENNLKCLTILAELLAKMVAFSNKYKKLFFEYSEVESVVGFIHFMIKLMREIAMSNGSILDLDETIEIDVLIQEQRNYENSSNSNDPQPVDDHYIRDHVVKCERNMLAVFLFGIKKNKI
jgi:hypothetical protein